MSAVKTVTLKRAVITGLGALTPVGNNVRETWSSLIAGTSGAGPITRFDAAGFRTRFACEVKGFEPLDHFEAKEIKKLDLFTQFSMVAANEAFQDAGLQSAGFDRTRAGVIWASGMGGLSTLDEQVLDYGQRRGKPRFSPFFVPRIIANIASGLISITHDLQGVNFTVVSACASSTNALAEAFSYIRLGKADIVISGGAEAAITESGVGGFTAMKALSEHNDDPAHASRPFDVNRDGFVIGEGACALVLEEYEHALRRGARIYAELRGVGASADAYHMTATHPEGGGAFRAMREALEDAGISSGAVNHISAHATSTSQGDLSEIKAIEKLFSPHYGNLSVSAVKSATGHLLGAAGALAAISCVKSIQEQIIPPTINTVTRDAGIPAGLDLTLGTAQERPVAVAMNNAFGFGGHCASAVFAACDGRS